MKQPVKNSRSVAGKSVPRRKTRAELNQEGRQRKRQKKHKGLASGQRANPVNLDANQGNAKSTITDPRFGSKKPVPLLADGAVVSKNPSLQDTVPAKRISAREELAMLENSEQLDGLLERIEQGEQLNSDEQRYLDTTLDRIEELMTRLGISVDDGVDDPQAEEDMYRLLKGQ